MEENTIIKTDRLAKRYQAGSGQFTALRDISLTFGKGEFCGLVGPSGSGKTTLLNILGSLDVPSEGEAEVIGQQISQLTSAQAAVLRNLHIGFIFQTANLLPVYTVQENVEFPLLLQRVPAAKRVKYVAEALEWVGLADKAGMKPAQLSGGECQRVAIARAMVKKPEIVLADEPSANLDAQNTHHILKTMKQLNRDLRTTFIFATHDEKVMQYLERKIYLRDGVVEKDQRSGS